MDGFVCCLFLGLGWFRLGGLALPPPQREEKGCGGRFMEAASRGLHGTGADDGLERARSGESRKPPPWCLSGTRALTRKNPSHRASSGNSPEKKSQEDDGKMDISVSHGKAIVKIHAPTGRASRHRRGVHRVGRVSNPPGRVFYPALQAWKDERIFANRRANRRASCPCASHATQRW